MKKRSILCLIMLSGYLFPMQIQAQYLVKPSISINKIYGINTIDQTYQIDGYLVFSWQDKAVNIKPETGQRIYENRQIDQVIDNGLWFPAFEFINIIGQRIAANRRLILSSSGEVTYNERFQGTFSTEMDFRRFPFDSQNFEIVIEPFSYEQDQLTFGSTHVFLEEPENKNLSEWDFHNKPTAEVSKHVYHHLDNTDNTFFSRLTVSIEALRKPNYYLWQFILPLSLILAASWSVFWIEGFAERLSTAFTMMLTVVAYTFYTSSILPRLPYTTFIERMIIMGYLSIFTSILIIIFVKIRESKGQSMDTLIRQCRYIFPSFFMIAIGILVGVNNYL